jgi:hypothetical protein
VQPRRADRVITGTKPLQTRRFRLTGQSGGVALLLYELAIHDRLAWADFDSAPALTRFVSYVAAGVVVGFLAQRSRRMLAQSLVVLEDLIELAHGRLEEGERLSAAAEPSLE